MLIVQIALGIVLAVVLLAFLPQIFSITIWVALAVLVIAAVGIGIYFLTSEPVVIVVLAVIAVCGYLVRKDSTSSGEKAEEKRRKMLGYDE